MLNGTPFVAYWNSIYFSVIINIVLHGTHLVAYWNSINFSVIINMVLNGTLIVLLKKYAVKQ